MRMSDVDFDSDTITGLMDKPLMRDNINNLREDFKSIYSSVLSLEIEADEETLSRMKTDLFASFCHGAQCATRIDSKFRKGFVTPKEFGGKTSIIGSGDGLVIPKKLDLIL